MGLLDIFFKKTKNKEYKIQSNLLHDYIEIELENFKDHEFEYLLSTDIFKKNNKEKTLILEYKDVYLLNEEELKFLNIPNFFSGILSIRNSANLLNSIEGVKFLVEYIDSENEKYIYLHHNLIEKRKDGEYFLLKEEMYQLINEIEEYNKDLERTKQHDEQYKIVDKIKKYGSKKDVILDISIQNTKEVKIVENLEIDFKEKDEENLDIIVKLKNLETEINQESLDEEFGKELKRANSKIYTLKYNGKEVDVVFSKKFLDALQVLKENKLTIKKVDFLKKDSPIFLDEKMNLEEIEYNYGPRVKGLGFLNYRANPQPNNSDIEWFTFEFPYIDTVDGEQIKLFPETEEYLEKKLKELNSSNEDEILVEFDTEDGKKSMFLKEKDLQNEILKIKNSHKEIIDFKKLSDLKNILELMRNEEKDYVEYKGCFVKKVDNLEIIEELIEQKEQEEKLKEKNKKEVLLLKDNIEELEHIEEQERCEVKNKFFKPESLVANLYPYQEDGVALMQALYNKKDVNGILLSDDMGLGKTLQILTFLAWVKEKKGDIKGLLVMPTSLTTNWYFETENEEKQGEIQRFFKSGTFKVKVINGKLKNNDLEDIQNSDLLITSYETLRINHIDLGKIEWDVMVCDEAQKIKNPTTLLTTAIKTQNARFKIACSATPIENTIVDLWCLVDFSTPGLLGSLREFKKKYLKKDQTNSELKNINDELKEKLGNNFLRRTKEILNEQDKKFPKKIVIYNHLKYSNKQKEILEICNNARLQGEMALPLIQRMIMTCSHPKLVEDSDKIVDSVAVLERESLKLKNTREILENIKRKNEKAIIFTKFKKMQKILYLAIKEWFNLEASIINGESNSESRKILLDDFKGKDGFDVIILSPEAAGVGLNIVEANHVIHYTRHWNPAKEDQATDRAYRIKQTKDVYVYYPLVAEDESFGELKFNNLDELLEFEGFNFNSTSSPEEKLNRIILKKKRLLRDFFLAAPIDLDEKDFEEFKDTKITKDKPLTIEHIDILDWEFLEKVAVIILEKELLGKGYLTKKSSDFGIDGLIELENGEFVAIQVKKSKNKIGRSALDEVLRGKTIYERELEKKISKVAVVTNAEVTDELKELKGKSIEIIDRQILSKLLLKNKITIEDVENIMM